MASLRILASAVSLQFWMVALADVQCMDCEADEESSLLQTAKMQQRSPYASILQVVSFVPYPGYQGELQVEGTVTIEGQGLLQTGAQILSWDLRGVDMACHRYVPGFEYGGGKCGIHIHKGTSCFADAGPHFWNTELFDKDPWNKVDYGVGTVWNNLGAKADNVKVLTGLTNFDITGHTVVVHDSTGARVACGIINAKELRVPSFRPYYNYCGDLNVHGNVGIKPEGAGAKAGQVMSWNLKGTDPVCKTGSGGTFANSCGIGIYEGTSCSKDGLAHYWNKTTHSDDPWANVDYRLDYYYHDEAEAKDLSVATGLEVSQVNGHALLVHDYAGRRIACGIVVPKYLVANSFVPYFSYTGGLKVAGWFAVEEIGVAHPLRWGLVGADPACMSPLESGANANACGIHIHTGKLCTKDAGGHFYSKSLDSDPWVHVKYSSTSGATLVKIGLSNYDTLGHTVIVHDRAGGRIACGILSIAEASD